MLDYNYNYLSPIFAYSVCSLGTCDCELAKKIACLRNCGGSSGSDVYNNINDISSIQNN